MTVEPRLHLGQGAGAMTQAIFHLGGQYPEAVGMAVRHKKRIVAEASLPLLLKQQRALHCAAEGTQRRTRARQHHAAAKPRGEGRLRSVHEFLAQDQLQLFPVVRIRGSRAGIAGGIHPRRTAKRIHLETGVIGKDKEVREGSTEMQRLEPGVFLKGVTRLLSSRDFRMRGEIRDCPARAEHGADFIGLVTVAGGNEELVHGSITSRLRGDAKWGVQADSLSRSASLPLPKARAWRNMACMNTVALPARPTVVIWFKVYGWFMVVYSLGIAALSLVFFLMSPQELEMPRGDAIVVGSICLAMGLSFAAAGLPPLISGPRPWSWVYSLVLICIGLTSCTLVVCIPLLIFWLKPEVKAYYGKE